MSASHKFSRTWHSLGVTGLLLVLAGCSAPKEARTPPPPAPVSSINAVQPVASPASAAMYATSSFAGSISSVAQLPEPLRSRWQATGAPESALSLVIAEVGQPPIVGINPMQPRNPASVMKLVTTYAALEALGSSHTWRTELLTGANAMPLPDGTLPGPLYVRASGDPRIELEDVWRMLRELRLQGVRTLPGIVIDDSVYGDVAIDPGEFDNSPDRVYNASPDALLVGFGALRLRHIPDTRAGAWRVVVDPPLPGVRVENQVRASQASCPGAPAVRTQQTAQGQEIVLRVSGTVALSCGEFSLYRLALPPREHTARALQQMWSELGGQLTGPVIRGLVPPDAVTLAAHDSPPLSELIRTINKQSNNVMARMMLLALGEQYGQPATVQTGGVALARALAERGLVFPELVVENGSGLSRNGRVSASSMASMLNAAWMSERMPEFISSLAIAGEDGTVRRRLKANGARGKAHLKTGTLRDVSALAGYVQGASGKRYVLVSMTNDTKAFNTRAFNDALVQWLSEL